MNAAYRNRRTYLKYDDEQYLLYLNETEATVTEPETEQSFDGFAYDGDMSDGGTIIAAKDITDEDKRSKFVAGLIGKQYSIDSQIAILANGSDTAEHAAELTAFLAYRQSCKNAVDELLSR